MRSAGGRAPLVVGLLSPANLLAMVDRLVFSLLVDRTPDGGARLPLTHFRT